ncbi:MAG: transposase [Pseudonocardiaceae bacterium]
MAYTLGVTRPEIKRTGGALWRAYQLKEALRAVFAGDLDPTDTNVMLDRWCSKAQRSRIPEFVKAAATIRKHRDGINVGRLASTIDELTDFRTQALARLAAQHDEITRLRGSAAAASRVPRLPRPAVTIGSRS